MKFPLLSARRQRAFWFALCGCLTGAAPAPAWASDAASTLHGSRVQPLALQELLKYNRPSGPLYVSIPQAGTFGVNTAYAAFCSPSITLVNTSIETVDELIVGIRYFDRSRAGVVLASTITRFLRVRPGRDSVDFFTDAIRLPTCSGLQGELEVVRCYYTDGRNCAGDVRPLGYGAIPLSAAGSKETRP